MRAIRVALCLGVLAGLVTAVSAEDDLGPEPGLRFAVTGVAGNDTLNVRNDADVEAGIIASLPHDAGGLAVSGRWQAYEGSVWWEVLLENSTETRGWVNSRYLASETDYSRLESDYPLECQGTEPFWALSVDGAVATGDAYYLENQTFAASAWQNAFGMRGWFAVVLAPTSEASQKDGILTVTRTVCSDGMSDQGYPFLTTLVLPDRSVYGGCCFRSAP